MSTTTKAIAALEAARPSALTTAMVADKIGVGSPEAREVLYALVESGMVSRDVSTEPTQRNGRRGYRSVTTWRIRG